MSASSYLIFRDEARWNEVFRLTSDRVTTIGRAPTNVIVLKDDRCSRAHAEIFYNAEQDAWFIRDRHSRNGTLVNGRKLDSEAEIRLSSNDTLMFGRSHLMFLHELRDIPSNGSSVSNFPSAPLHDELLPGSGKEDFSEKSDNSSVFGNSHVFSGNFEVAEETMITYRRDKARLLETMDLDHASIPGTTGKRIRRSIANLCRLAIEISRAGEHSAKLELALEYLLRELPVNQAAILLLPAAAESDFQIQSLEIAATMGIPASAVLNLPPVLPPVLPPPLPSMFSGLTRTSGDGLHGSSDAASAPDSASETGTGSYETLSHAAPRPLPVLEFLKGEKNAAYQKVSDYLAQTVLESRNAVIARHVRGDSVLGRRNSEGVIETTSVICAPIFTDQRRWGLLHVYSTDPSRVPDVQDLDFTLGVAEILGILFENVREQAQMEENLKRARNENADLRKQLGVQSEIIGTSPAVQEITEQIALAANSRATVLIHGESGVGKELVARAVHFSSPRKKAPFICLNCAVLSEDLLASELFGHERGAFTGATDRKIGKFEAANGGTLMLDEIGEMGLNIQAKFLRVLEGHPFERVGGTKPISVDVRVIAATNRDLEQEVMAGRFRKDLFFRLRVVEILVPPLRQRLTDIPILAEHFFRHFKAETGRKLEGFSPDALALLQKYAWPGNIRELKNVIERAVVLARGTYIETTDLLLSNLSTEGGAGAEAGAMMISGSASAALQTPPEFTPMTLEDVELEHIRKMLEFTEGNKSRAAQLLGIERTTLDRKIRKIQE